MCFYPKADTSGCTKQACSRRAEDHGFSAIGVSALGIGPDDPGKLEKFAADTAFVLPALGPGPYRSQVCVGRGEKKMYGEMYEEIIRPSFLGAPPTDELN